MITVLLFAELQEATGRERIEVEVNDMSVSELKDWMKRKYSLPQIDRVMTAVNEEYALPTDRVKSGDVVAFIPPVSGG
ncbi:molybdopterin converting factor subunit 1 [Ornithinibacillus bavariensis]|uniref:Molybdopterin synthase sulfur carrier subunit n=1 Tax=Ornithinibacillus bavariensis TaxID=545502 RepID=A0A919X6G4_9BACI|nr:molybdopterin converting factor subunit 1 [Ornithinibacillus bavariensis]GIO25919.1 molybdopterin synthase sulfur carrier subunit [Ornithinibacillus bavariensis]